LNKHQVLT